MHELKTGLYADKFATFWIFPERYYRSFVLQMTLPPRSQGLSSSRGKMRDPGNEVDDPYTLYNWLNVSRLGRFRKARNRVNRGKTQC